jgi:hypothetical protein
MYFYILNLLVYDIMFWRVGTNILEENIASVIKEEISKNIRKNLLPAY